jgi:hypothetical protein
MNQPRNSIRSILMAHWDPIGVCDEPAAADEYDSYVAGLSRLLAKAATAGEIAAHLLEIERAEMGLPGNAPRAARAAKALTVLQTAR